MGHMYVEKGALLLCIYLRMVGCRGPGLKALGWLCCSDERARFTGIIDTCSMDILPIHALLARSTLESHERLHHSSLFD